MAYLRNLREFVVRQCEEHLRTNAADPDPFFPGAGIPELIPVVATGFNATHTISLSDYLDRISRRYPSFGMGGQAPYRVMGVNLLGNVFQVGIGTEPENTGCHFLILPEPRLIPEMMADMFRKIRQPYDGQRMRGTTPR
jgi:hypothetical protein